MNPIVKVARLKRLRTLFIVACLFGTLYLCRGLWWPVWFQNSARHALKQYENQKALARLDWATFLAPTDSETEFLRARAYRRIGDLNRSMNSIKKARSINGPSERLMREEWLCQAQAGQMSRVEQRIPELLKDPRGDTDDIYESFFLGSILVKNHASALYILNSWVEASPDHSRPYCQRARFWLLRSKTGQAIEDFQHAVALDPGNHEAAVELAALLQDRSEFERAIPLFEQCLNDQHVAVRAHIGLAVCLKSIGETRRVRSLLETAVKRSTKLPQALCELGRLDLETGHYASAVAHLTEAVRIAPRDDECHFVLAQSLVADGKSDLARPHFEFAQSFRDEMRELSRCEDLLSRNPRDVELMVRTALIELNGPEPEEGIMRLFSVLEIEPKHQQAKKILAEHFSAAAQLNPEFRKLAEKFRDSLHEGQK